MYYRPKIFLALVVEDRTNQIKSRAGYPLFRVLTKGIYEGEEDSLRNLQKYLSGNDILLDSKVVAVSKGSKRYGKWLADADLSHPLSEMNLVSFREWILNQEHFQTLGDITHPTQHPLSLYFYDATEQLIETRATKLVGITGTYHVPVWAAMFTQYLLFRRIKQPTALDLFKSLGDANTVLNRALNQAD
jgi:hypothetical protein